MVSRLKQEVQELRLRVKELEEDCKQIAACKQKEVEKLMAKCAAEEEGRRKAEEGRQRADEAHRQADEGRRRAEEGRRRAEASLGREKKEYAGVLSAWVLLSSWCSAKVLVIPSSHLLFRGEKMHRQRTEKPMYKSTPIARCRFARMYMCL